MRILNSKIARVVSVVKANPTQFGNELVQNGLVQEFDPDDKTMNRTQTVTFLYDTAMNSVKLDPKKFSVMVDILSEYTSLEAVVKEMKNEGELPSRLVYTR